MTGSIVFVPVCSKCRHLLTEQPIDYIQREDQSDYMVNVLHYRFEEDFEIKPQYCPNCQTVFLSIVTPGKFPVNVKQLFEFADK